MTVLREVDGYKLNIGDGMANGLYNISKGDNAEELSNWFDHDTSHQLMILNDEDYVTECKRIIADSEIE